MKKFAFVLIMLLFAASSFAKADEAEKEIFALPTPKFDTGKTVLQALKDRHSVKSFDSSKKLNKEQLASLLWAANGVNREAEKKRTAPSAHNTQNISLYVILKEGIYFYEPFKHELILVNKGDFTKLAGTQEYAHNASATVVMAATYGGIENEAEDKKMALINVGFVVENMYLFASSFDLATVCRTSIDKKALAKALKLKANQEVLIAQSVGFELVK